MGDSLYVGGDKQTSGKNCIFKETGTFCNKSILQA